jgi:predicted metalloprotease with PDZ domain
MRIAILLLVATTVFAQSHHRTENAALLGVVTGPAKKKLTVLHVLKKSPADKAGLLAGDEIVSIAGTKVTRPQEVDAALKSYKGGEKIAIEYRRADKTATADAKLIKRADYKGEFLKPQRRGATKFKAPEWFMYGWAQTGKDGEKPPTLATSKNKVIVLHCFQSW